MSAVVERYELHGEIARGGMATVHLGRRIGAAGFQRTVAIKRMHRHLAVDPAFVKMFVDEARLASHIQHPHVVGTLDVVLDGTELLLVLEYVRGLSLDRLVRLSRERGEPIAVEIACAIVHGALLGLHAAHEARDEGGRPLDIVHRDVSPHNVLVGVDGVARILDFGIAKAITSTTVTREGSMKGKVSYMAPEQLEGGALDRRTDVFAAGIVLWELLAGERLFPGDHVGAVSYQVLSRPIPSPEVHPALDAVVRRALERDRGRRYASARDFAAALEQTRPLASALEVGAWVERVGGHAIAHLDEEQTVLDAETESTVFTTSRPGVLSATSTEPTRPVPPTGGERSEGSSSRAPAWAPAIGVAALLGGGLAAWRVAPPDAERLRPFAFTVPVLTPPAPPSAAPSEAARSSEPSRPAPSSIADEAPRSSPPPRPSPPSRRDCSPPYYFRDGKKHFKPQCF